jgi:hypothetical protein
VADGNHLHHFDLKVTEEKKDRIALPEKEVSPIEAGASAAYTRAQRLGLNTRVTA